MLAVDAAARRVYLVNTKDSMRFHTTLIFPAALAGSLLLNTAQAENIVTIGHVAATSGPIAHLGKDNENGARMAVDEVNAKGLIIGGKRYKLVLQA